MDQNDDFLAQLDLDDLLRKYVKTERNGKRGNVMITLAALMLYLQRKRKRSFDLEWILTHVGEPDSVVSDDIRSEEMLFYRLDFKDCGDPREHFAVLSIKDGHFCALSRTTGSVECEGTAGVRPLTVNKTVQDRC